MQIECVNCSKKFEINSNQIPNEGRLLQCGICDHKWFYNKAEIEQSFKSKDDKIVNIISEQPETNDSLKEESTENQKFKKETKEESTENQKIKKETKVKSYNIFKMFLVFIITFFSLVLLLDTFKNQISLFFPNINHFLNNLYLSILDIVLFIKDLV